MTIRRLLHLGLLVYLRVTLCSLPSATVRGDTPAARDSVLFPPARDREKEDISFSLPPVARIEIEVDKLCLHTESFSLPPDVSEVPVIAEAAGLVRSRNQHGTDKFDRDYNVLSTEKKDVQDSIRGNSSMLPEQENKPATRVHNSAATVKKRELGYIDNSKPIHSENKAGVDGIPGLKSSELKKSLYNLLETIKSQPEEAIRALVMAQLGQKDLSRHTKDIRRHAGWGRTSQEATGSQDEWLDDTRNLHNKVSEMQTSDADHEDKSITAGYSNYIKARYMSSRTRVDSLRSSVSSASSLRSGRVRRKSKGVMYLPINQPQPDPCAAPKGSKLLEALPLVFLSSIMSVADAVGSVLNNINNNNRNNNNNNDNNINSDNTNLAANINNANQINLVPIGGRVLRIARSVMNSIGRMALGVYEAVLPSAGGDDLGSDVGDDVGGGTGDDVGGGTGTDLRGEGDNEDSTASRTSTHGAGAPAGTSSNHLRL